MRSTTVAMIACATLCALATSALAQDPPDLLAARGEPSEARVRAAALRHARLSGELNRWEERARWANAIPRIDVRATLTRRRDATTEYTEDQVRDPAGDFYVDDARVDVDRLWRQGDALTLRATWDLGRVVFDPNELAAARLAEQRRERRARLSERVAEIYWERRALLARLRITPVDEVDERITLSARVGHHTSSLDALTGGWFSRSIEKEEP